MTSPKRMTRREFQCQTSTWTLQKLSEFAKGCNQQAKTMLSEGAHLQALGAMAIREERRRKKERANASGV